jgi:hypothetical protein
MTESHNNGNQENENTNTETQAVINLDQFRSRKSEEKKRKTERIFFHNLVGVYGLVQPGKMVPIGLIDISEGGLAIQVPYPSETTVHDKVWPRDSVNLPIRLYFSADSFMEVLVNVKNSNPLVENGSKYMRYGCEVFEDQRTFGAWKSFVSFLRSYTEVSERDSGNISVGNI